MTVGGEEAAVGVGVWAQAFRGAPSGGSGRAPGPRARTWRRGVVGRGRWRPGRVGVGGTPRPDGGPRRGGRDCRATTEPGQSAGQWRCCRRTRRRPDRFPTRGDGDGCYGGVETDPFCGGDGCVVLRCAAVGDSVGQRRLVVRWWTSVCMGMGTFPCNVWGRSLGWRFTCHSPLRVFAQHSTTQHSTGTHPHTPRPSLGVWDTMVRSTRLGGAARVPRAVCAMAVGWAVRCARSVGRSNGTSLNRRSTTETLVAPRGSCKCDTSVGRSCFSSGRRRGSSVRLSLTRRPWSVPAGLPPPLAFLALTPFLSWLT